jgi:hypothetical protein
METHVHQPEKFEVKIVRPFWSRLWVRLCIIFFLGFLAGSLVFNSFKKDKQDNKVLNSDQPGAVAGLQTADTIRIAEPLHYDSPMTKAVYKVRYSPKIVEIRVELSSLYPVKSMIEFDVNNLVILDVQHITVNDQSGSVIAANFIQFNSVGDNKYTILLSNKNSLPHAIDFSLFQNEVAIFRNPVRINND